MCNQDGVMVSGTVHSINVGKRGIEVNVTNPDVQAEASLDRPYYTCRLDRSSTATPMMLKLATTAMVNQLPITLLGVGDDRDEAFEFDEVRVLAPE